MEAYASTPPAWSPYRPRQLPRSPPRRLPPLASDPAMGSSPVTRGGNRARGREGGAEVKPAPTPSTSVTEEPAVPYVPPPPTVQDDEQVDAARSRPGEKEGLNLPLAVTAVLTAASLVGAQIGVLLGLRDKRRAARQRTRRP
ncbi:hypothetical protein [Phytohabitans flavus]